MERQRGLVWKCAQSITEAEFKVSMEAVKRKNEKACVYLDKWPRESWTKAYLSENCKVDNITNNNCESFNAKILKFRNKPILSLCEDIRTYIMRKMTSAKLKMATRLGPLVPMQQSRLEKEKLESNKWTANWVGDPDGTRFEVCHHETRIDVDLQNQSCTCRMWQLTGIPLHHLNLSIMDFMYCISMKIVFMRLLPSDTITTDQGLH